MKSLGNSAIQDNTPQVQPTTHNSMGQSVQITRNSFGQFGHRQSVNFSAGLRSKIEFGRRTDWVQECGHTIHYVHYVDTHQKQMLTYFFNAGSPNAFGPTFQIGFKHRSFIQIPGDITSHFKHGGRTGQEWQGSRAKACLSNHFSLLGSVVRAQLSHISESWGTIV